MKWQLQEAKQKFSEVVQRVLDEGPQVITRRGKEVVVIVSTDEYARLNGSKPDFKEFLLSFPDLEPLEIERSKEHARTIEL